MQERVQSASQREERPEPAGRPPDASGVIALQRAAGNHAVARMLARKPQAKPRLTNDDIAREFGAANWAEFKAERQGSEDTVFGQTVKGLQDVFLTELHAAEQALAASHNGGQPIPAEDWATKFGVKSVGGLRFNGSEPAGMHGWGLAIDINAKGAPFVMHEHGEKELDASLGPVYHRVAWLILRRASVIPEAINKRSATSTRDWHHVLQAESEAMRQYFRMMRNPDDVDWNTVFEDMTPELWAQLGVGPMPAGEDPLQVQEQVRELLRRQMAQDYATLGAKGGQDVGGGIMTPVLPPVMRTPNAKTGKASEADRPFKGDRDPAQGFMDLDVELAVALRARPGVRWGAVDFEGESGDVMHFDMLREYVAKRDAAAAKLAESQ